MVLDKRGRFVQLFEELLRVLVQIVRHLKKFNISWFLNFLVDPLLLPQEHFQLTLGLLVESYKPVVLDEEALELENVGL